MNICVIGAGNVATHFAIGLQQAGHYIAAIYSRHLPNANLLAQRVNAPLATNNLTDLPSAQVYLFAVKDDALPQTAQILMSVPNANEGLWVHTAGSVSINVLPQNRLRAVLYPMMTLSKNTCVDLRSLPLFVEGGNALALEKVTDIAHDLSDNVSVLDSDKRMDLHLAAIFANNFANHCFALAYKLLENKGINPECLLPIIDETAQKLHRMPPLQAQTGPAKRWDTDIITEHLKKLEQNSELQQIYRLMSKSIHKSVQEDNSQNKKSSI